MAANLTCDKFWVNKSLYHDAEKKYHECAAKLQRRLEIFGSKSEEVNNKKSTVKNSKKIKKSHHSVNVNDLQSELHNREAQENEKNKIFHCETHCFEIINPKEYHHEKNENFIDSEKKIQNKEQQKEKKNISEKKPKRTKENEDDLLAGVGMKKIIQDVFPKSSLAGEVAKARQHIKSSLECMENMNGVGNMNNTRLIALLEKMQSSIENLTKRVEVLEKRCAFCKKATNAPVAVCPAKPKTQTAPKPPAKKEEDDDDIDLFGSESEEDEEAKKIKEQRLAEYQAKKSKKPAVVAKSNIILDIKPWDDETDMKEMEKAVRAIEMDGLLWGASKLVPVAFNIFKLQISCVIEDDKVSVDLLTETLEEIQDYIQSVDIAAFNKV